MDDFEGLLGGSPDIPAAQPPPSSPEAAAPDPELLARQRRAAEQRRRGRNSLIVDPATNSGEGTGIRII